MQLTIRVGSAPNAWDDLLPEFRSEHRGWTTAGEFRCPYCWTAIGMNLKGQKPFLHAARHLREEHGKTPGDMARGL